MQQACTTIHLHPASAKIIDCSGVLFAGEVLLHVCFTPHAIAKVHALAQDSVCCFSPGQSLSMSGSGPKAQMCIQRVREVLSVPASASVDQDSVRLLAVQCCGPLARTLSRAECQSTVVPIVQRFAQVCKSVLTCSMAHAKGTMCFLSTPLVYYAPGHVWTVMCRTSLGECVTMWHNSCMSYVSPWALKLPGKFTSSGVPVAVKECKEWPRVMRCNVYFLSHGCRSDVLPPFLKLLRDSEAEVRVAAASKVASISNLLELDAVRTQFLSCRGIDLGTLLACQHI